MSDKTRANHRKRDVWKGLAAGLVGGMVASWTMNQFQAAWTRAAEGLKKPQGAQPVQPGEDQKPGQALEENKEDHDDATVKAARAISDGVFGHELKESKKKVAGSVVHYAFGAA